MDNNTNNWKEFTLGNPQEEPPKRIEKKHREKKRILWFALLIVVVLAVVAVVFLWDQSSFDGLRRSIIYATAKKDESGCAELYSYNGDQTSCFAALDGSLIDLSYNQLTSVDALKSSVTLQKLNISNNQLTAIDGLSALSKLTDLNFSYNQVSVIPAFSTKCDLVTIDGSHNLISSLEPLKGLESLNKVYMDYNENTDSVDPLASCRLLILVNVYGTKVTKVSALTDMSVIVNYKPV